jgi:putative transposase
MTDGNVFALNTPAHDTLNEVLKRGAQQLPAQAVEAEVAALLAEHRDLQVDGRQAVVRNGYLPERMVQTGLGDVTSKSQRYAIARAVG